MDDLASIASFEDYIPPYPYPGLRPFEYKEWSIFFGREAIVEEIIERLLSSHVVILHGLSGSGKSSVVRAGVLPRLSHESNRSGLGWRVCAFTPGRSPLDAFAASLHSCCNLPDSTPDLIEIRRSLNFGEAAPTRLAGILSISRSDSICVLIDQYEELFEEHDNLKYEGQILSDIIAGASKSPESGIYVIVTMRSERIGAAAAFRGFAETINRTQCLLPRISHADLIRSIREPALSHQCIVDRDLAEHLIAEVSANPDQLPLIQHTLQRLYASKLTARILGEDDDARIVLSLQDLPTDHSLINDISAHANDVLRNLVEAGIPESSVESIFRALATVNPDGTVVRRPRNPREIQNETELPRDVVMRIVDEFRAEGTSFLRPYGDASIADVDLIDVGHEALIRCWDRLAIEKNGWLQKEYEDGQKWRLLLSVAETAHENAPSWMVQERIVWISHRTAGWSARYGDHWEYVKGYVNAAHEKLLRKARWRRLIRGSLNLAAFLAIVITSAVLFFLWKSSSQQAQHDLSAYENTDRDKDEDVATLKLRLEEKSAAFDAFRAAVDQSVTARQKKRIDAAVVVPSTQMVTGYVWLGNDSTSNVELIARPKGHLKHVQVGDELKSVRDLAIRQEPPTDDGKRSDVLGQMSAGTTFRAIAPSTIAPGTTTGADQYWIKTTVSLDRRSVTSLYYPRSVADGEHSDLSKMINWLGRSGFKVDKKQVYELREIKTNEVMACHRVDDDQAKQLLSLLERAGSQRQFSAVLPAKPVRMNSNCRTTTAPGRLELYVKDPVFLTE